MQNQVNFRSYWNRFYAQFTIRLKLLLFIVLIYCLTIHFTLQGPNPTSRFLLTKSIAERGEFWFPKEDMNFTSGLYREKYWLAPDYAVINDTMYSDKAPGLSFLAVPLFISGKIIGMILEPLLKTFLPFIWRLFEPYIDYYPDKDIYAVVAIQLGLSFFAGLGILRLYDITRLMGISERNSIIASVITAFATPYWVYARTMFGHVPAAVFLISSLYHILKFREDNKLFHLIFAGFFSGFGFVIEFPLLFTVPWLSFLLVFPLNKTYTFWKRRFKSVLIYGIITVFFALPLFIYNFISFGDITANALAFSHWADNLHLLEPVHEGLFVLLLSNSRGLLYFSPIAIFGIVGLFLSYRRYPMETVVIFSLILNFILFYAKKWESHGGAAFGPRYIVPILLLIGIGIGWIIEYMKYSLILQAALLLSGFWSFLSTYLGALYTVLIFGQEDPIFVEALNKYLLGDTNALILRQVPLIFIICVIIIVSIFFSGTILASKTHSINHKELSNYEVHEAYSLFSWGNFIFIVLYFTQICFILSATYIRKWETNRGEIFVKTLPPSELWLIIAFFILILHSTFLLLKNNSAQIRLIYQRVSKRT